MAGIYSKQVVLLIKRLFIAYVLYFLSRLLFYAGNHHAFAGTGVFDLLSDCFYGLRFDSFSIVISNSLFILLSLLPINAFNRAWFQTVLRVLFVFCNALFLAFNFIDVGYFAFIRKRSSSELFDQLGGQSDLGKLLPQFAIDFWWILLLYLTSIWLIHFLYKRIRIPFEVNYKQSGFKPWLLVAAQFILAAGFAVLGARGGLQRVPIDIVNAGAVARAEEVPLVLNTPFTIIKSVNQSVLEDLHFYEDTELKRIYDPIHCFKDSTAFKKWNVVVLILESFSKEYTKLAGKQSITPFLDSLMDHGLVFSNAFSNGTKSIEGIPAILSGLPSFMDNPFINSIYANNFQTSFATVLKKEGYQTAFFHGGINGTMNFTDWAPSAGYDAYYGRNEYNNEADFDGFWGIWDEPFLQYSIREMNGFKQPFHSAIFTLSSHHPYKIPDQYKGRFPKTNLENAESIGYADHALRLFFESAKKTNWYQNTLFILTADHASISEHLFYSNSVGNLTIPILFFQPGDALKGRHTQSFSQMDILPSALQLMGYQKPFFAFGQPYKSEVAHNNYCYASGNLFLNEDSMLYQFNRSNLVSVFNYSRDSVLAKNIRGQYPLLDSLIYARYKAFIQTYHHTLIHNTGVVK